MKRLVAEFEEQSYTQIIFPHKNTDWAEYLQEAQQCFTNIINSIIKYQKCLVVCADIDDVKSRFEDNKNLHFVEYTTDDTWARDCSALCVEDNSKIELLDFTFTGWGGKFESSKDNAMTSFLTPNAIKCDMILEGGGVESNGIDAILTTSECMLNKNRNHTLSKEEITQKLKSYFGASKIHYLNHGYLAGDDTDSHIDTLARFVDKDKIMYVKCDNPLDEHYKELSLMEDELKLIAKENKYKLIPLPMSDAIYFDDERLPATYANFLFVNGAVLVPVYGVKQDEKALEIFKDTFPHRDIIGINCYPLIKQHGSLHCVTMNFKDSTSIYV
jgi:agmatine/peptidylarginine deiminase